MRDAGRLRAWAMVGMAVVGLGRGGTALAVADPAGVVVEEVSSMGADGLLPGDVLLSWRQAGEGGTAGGAITRPMDLWVLKYREILRRSVELEIRRGDQTLRLELRDGPWRVKLRPHLAPDVLAIYRQGWPLGTESLDVKKEIWRRAHEQLAEPIARTWWAIEMLELRIRLEDPLSVQAEADQLLSDLGDPLEQLYLLSRVGSALKAAGDYEAASARFAQGLEILQVNPSGTVFEAYWLNWLGILDLGRGRLEQARARFQKVSDLVDREAPQSMSKATAVSGLGHVARQQGDLDTAEAAWRTLADLYGQLAPGSQYESEAFNNLGILEYDRGRMSAAEAYFRRSLNVAEQRDPRGSRAGLALNNLAECYRERGLLAESELLLERSLAIITDAVPLGHEMALVLDSVGSLAQDRGDLVAAEEYYRRMVEVYRQLAPQSLDTAFGLHRLGALALAKGELEEALALTAEARAMRFLLAPDSPELADSLLQLAELARRRGEQKQAQAFALEALEVQTALAPESLRTSESHHLLGELALESADGMETAIEHFDRALAIRQHLAPHSAAVSATLLALGRAWRETEPEVSAKYYRLSLVALESQIGRLGGTELQRSRYRANAEAAYDEYVELLLTLERPGDAFDALERSRARGFLELLAGRDLLGDELPSELVDERRELAVRYERTQEQIRATESRSQVPTLVAELDRLRRRYERVGVELQRLSPSYQALRPTRILNLKQAAQQLDPGTVLLSFQSAAAGSHVFALSRGGELMTAPLPAESVLRRQIELVNRLVDGTGESQAGQRRQRRAERLLRALYQQLLGPIESSIAGADRLLILPDGPLHRLPWAALVRSLEGEAASYLIEWKPIYLALSATAHAQLAATRPTVESSISELAVTAFGDPDYGSGASPTGWPSSVRRGLDLAPLPASRFEVERIANLFPGSSVFLGERAVEEAVKTLSRGTRIVHFAVHGVLDSRSPLDSALAFSRPDPSWTDGDRRAENGLLQAWEIFEGVRLDADLVMLSACRSGLGEELAGEGLIGLTRAFQVAGARSVAAALWLVSDLSTQALVVRFYEHLRSGKPKADALRAAQLELLAAPVTVVGASGVEESIDASLPLHWAGFQLYGDWR